ncbi:hypothetical protein [Serratia sp. FDAARGOS_506]|uniref:hypothetical protein n=1 Tax=Serratia sp. FDAARGOS_506 TaxID=2420306 RepID=UPI0020A2C01A|nr:hypothetical protein [Serratia sp. FDAARGOS_506]
MTCETSFNALKKYIQSLEKYGAKCDEVRINNEQKGSQNGKKDLTDPRPPEELPEWEAIGPFRKSKRHLIERTDD